VGSRGQRGEVFGCEAGGDEAGLSLLDGLLALLLLGKHHERGGRSGSAWGWEGCGVGAATGAVLYFGTLVLEPVKFKIHLINRFKE